MQGGCATSKIGLTSFFLAFGRPGNVSCMVTPPLLSADIPYSSTFEVYWNCTFQKVAMYFYHASIEHRCIRLSELVCAIFWVCICLSIIIETLAYWGVFSIRISSDVAASATTGSWSRFVHSCITRCRLPTVSGWSVFIGSCLLLVIQTYNYALSNVLTFVNRI